MVRREKSVSSFKTWAPLELEVPPRACGASHVRVPHTSVTLKAKTVEILISWGFLPSSLHEAVPCNGLVVLNGPRSLHLRSGVGVAEVLTLALKRRDSRQLPDLRGFSHATNPAALATNWRNLLPYVEFIGIWIGETWSKALERGDADAVGRLVDFIADRQTSYEKNVLAYDNTPLPIPEASNVTAARVSGPGTTLGLHETLVNSSSWPSQQNAIPNTAGSPAAPALRGIGNSAVSVGKEDVAAVDYCRRLPSHSERSQAAVARGLTRTAAPCSPQPSAGKEQAHSRENQAQQLRPSLELTKPHCQNAKSPVAVQSHATEMLPSSDVLLRQEAPSAQLQPEGPQVSQAEATELRQVAVTAGGAVIAAVRLKQVECQSEDTLFVPADFSSGLQSSTCGCFGPHRAIVFFCVLRVSPEPKFLMDTLGLPPYVSVFTYAADIAGPYVALSGGVQPLLPLLHDSQSNDASRSIYRFFFPGHCADEALLYPLRQSSSLSLNGEGRCREDAASLNPLAFSPVECPGTPPPPQIESNPLLEEIPCQQRQSENSRQQQEGKLDIEMKEAYAGELATHVRGKAELPLSISPLDHGHPSKTESVASCCEEDKKTAHPKTGAGGCWTLEGVTSSQTQLSQAFGAITTEDRTAQMQTKPKGSKYMDDEPLEAEEIYGETITSQIAEDSPAIAETQLAMKEESGECQIACMRHERQLTARRRTSSIFKNAGGDCGLPQDASFVASVIRQQQFQKEGTHQQRQADPIKSWVQENQDCDSWPHKENIEEVLLQSLKIHFGFDRRTSIQVVQQKGNLLEALFARAGTHAFSKGVAGWIGALKESAATAARRLEGEPQKTGIVMQIYYNGAAFLHRQGQLVHATALLEALSVLLLALTPASVALQHRLVCHLRRSTAAVSIAQLAAAAAEVEAYVQSKAATEMLAAIGSLCHQWCQMKASDIWSGGFLRRTVGCDMSYFLLTRLLLQQHHRMQKQHHFEEEATECLPLNVLRAIAVEACTAVSAFSPAVVFSCRFLSGGIVPLPLLPPSHASGSAATDVAAAVSLQALQQNNADWERAAALLVLGPISRCCCSMLAHEEHEVVLQLMRQLLKCIQLATAIEEVFAAAERGVCTSGSVTAALASVISATAAPAERAEAVDTPPENRQRRFLRPSPRYVETSLSCLFFEECSLTEAAPCVTLQQIEARQRGTAAAAALVAVFAQASPQSSTMLRRVVSVLLYTQVKRTAEPVTTSLLCGLVVSCWEHHGTSVLVQQITKKLLVLDRLRQSNVLASETAGGGTRGNSDCLAKSLKAFLSHESQEVALTGRTKEAILALCEECLVSVRKNLCVFGFGADEGEGTLSQVSSLTHSEIPPALEFPFSAVSCFLHELHKGRDAMSASSQQQGEHQQEADYEKGSSAHWLSMVGGPESSASSEATDCRRPSTSISQTPEQGAIVSGTTRSAPPLPDDQGPEKVPYNFAFFS
ncbi:hypothetical protein Emag_007723 [Eimeria magna]